jgi:CBS domain containing-hemolysin-like protein
MQSTHSRLPVTTNGRLSSSQGFVHKKDVLKALLAGNEVQIESLVRPALRMPASLTILNALEQMRRESTHIAFVVNERDGFIGLLTVTDILESIAGQLPDTSDLECVSPSLA